MPYVVNVFRACVAPAGCRIKQCILDINGSGYKISEKWNSMEKQRLNSHDIVLPPKNQMYRNKRAYLIEHFNRFRGPFYIPVHCLQTNLRQISFRITNQTGLTASCSRVQAKVTPLNGASDHLKAGWGWRPCSLLSLATRSDRLACDNDLPQINLLLSHPSCGTVSSLRGGSLPRPSTARRRDAGKQFRSVSV